MKQAVILAAGEGQRLRPFTVTKPKVMLSIAGKPILQYVVEALAQNGIRQIVMVVGYKREQVFDYFGAGEQFGVNIDYITQEKQVGTAHALAQAKDAVENEFLILPGDNLIEANTIARFVTMKPNAVLVKRVENPAKYGVVIVDDSNLIKGIMEKPKEAESNIVNTGIYTLTKDIFGFLETELDLPNAVNDMIAQGYSIKAEDTAGAWLDVVYPWDILSVNEAALREIKPNQGGTIESGASIKGQVSIGKDTIIRSHCYIVGPVTIGSGCDIGPGVAILPSTSIGDNVVISPFTEISNSVIGDDVSIGSGSIVHDSVIDKGCVIKGRFTACSGAAEIKINGTYYPVEIGAMLGEGCSLGNNVMAQPGTILGNYSQVQALKLLSGQLPDRSLVL